MTDNPKVLQAIEDLHAEGLYHYGDTLHYDLYLARQRTEGKAALISLLTARNLARSMLGDKDPRVRQMTERLPLDLRMHVVSG